MEELSKETLIQNLKDAGCEKEFIRRFMELSGSHEGEKIKLLMTHRDKLLQKIHKDEHRITCLDYLIYQIEHRKIEIQENKEECEDDNSRKSDF